MKIKSTSFEAIENNKRIQPQGMPGKETPTHKTGIKVYSRAAGFFLFLFCVASRIKDANGKIWYVNKASLRNWGKSNSGEEKFKLRNLDQLLQDMKKPPSKKELTLNPEEKTPSYLYTKERIGKELWLREGQLVSENTQAKVNTVSEYLDKEGFELVGAVADGNCYFDAFSKSLGFSSRKIPIVQTQDNPIAYLRGFLSDLIKDPNRAQEIKEDKQFITALEGDKFASAFKIPIRVITLDNESQVHDFLTFPDEKIDSQEWKGVENKPKQGSYILIVDLGGHFITAKPKS